MKQCNARLARQSLSLFPYRREGGRQLGPTAMHFLVSGTRRINGSWLKAEALGSRHAGHDVSLDGGKYLRKVSFGLTPGGG